MLLAGKVGRSTSDIQRAYDAAPGPPTKGVVQDEGPPSAPPAPGPDRPSSGTDFRLTPAGLYADLCWLLS